jgi:hypothetical protein
MSFGSEIIKQFHEEWLAMSEEEKAKFNKMVEDDPPISDENWESYGFEGGFELVSKGPEVMKEELRNNYLKEKP